MRLARVTGPRGGIVFHNGDGFIYKKQKVVKGVIYFTCAITKCPCRGTLPKKRDVIRVTKPHNHKADPLVIEALALRKQILQKCRERKEPCRSIFSKEISKHPHLANHDFIRGMGSAMQRARFSSCPPVPDNLLGFQDMKHKEKELAKFTTTLKDQPWLLDVVVTADGEQAAIFLSPTMRKLMKSAEEFHVDASFKFVPSYPSCEVLTVISAIYQENAFPVIYMLMSRQTKAAYVKALRCVLQEEPDWSPKMILADYEAPLLYALQEVFSMSDTTSIHGCWFQYTQALWRKRRAMKLPLNSNTIALKGAQMAMALPALPVFAIYDGYNEVVSFLSNNLEGELLEQMLEFMEYVDDWLKCVGPEILSVDGIPNRSIFSMQQFHKSVLSHLRSQLSLNRPRFWQFIYALQQVESEKEMQLYALENQEFSVGRTKRREEMLQDHAIESSMQRLGNGHITIREFLHIMASRVFKPFLWNTGVEALQNDEAPELPDDSAMEVVLSSDDDDEVGIVSNEDNSVAAEKCSPDKAEYPPNKLQNEEPGTKNNILDGTEAEAMRAESMSDVLLKDVGNEYVPDDVESEEIVVEDHDGCVEVTSEILVDVDPENSDMSYVVVLEEII